MTLSSPTPLTEAVRFSRARLNEISTAEEKRFKHGAAALARQADFEGWGEDELTAALNAWGWAGEMVLGRLKTSPVKSGKTLKTSDPERASRLQKRQETIRITRQAEMEGWSDEKLVAALRLRHEIHHELRGKVPCT